jgi:uncharacterized repeat protein (TIGR01451 family)
MNTHHPAVIRRYSQILLASLLFSASLIPLLPALADQNTPAAGTTIENQATAEFTDSADTSATPPSIKIVSDIVKVTVAEVAGITIGNAPTITGLAYRGSKVYVDFKVYNSGNDPTKIFIPGKPSVAKLNGVDILAANIGAIKVIGYTTVAAGTTPTETYTAISTGNTVNSSGSSTGDLTGLTVAPSGGGPIVAPGGSIPAGAYITVRVEITVPTTATNGQVINITLGNTGGTDLNNQDYSAATPTANDLYTQDNTTTTFGDIDGNPLNGIREASKSTTITVNQVSITGTVWNDRDNSASVSPYQIQNGTEPGTNAVFGTSVIPVYAVLVDMTVPTSPIVLQSATVDAATGVYTFVEAPPNTNVKVLLLPNTTTVTNSSAAPAAAVKATLVPGWVGTSATELSFATTLAATTNQDFGIRQRAKLVLAKRITKIQNATINPNDTSKVLTTVIPDTFNFNPTKNPGNPASYVGNWPTVPDYLVGLTDAGKVKPDETIEYTIYFLNNQGGNAINVKFCDRIRGDQTYVPGSLYLKLGNGTEVNLADTGNTYTSTDALPGNCNSDAATTITGSDNGGIAISPANIPSIPGVTGVNTGVTTPSTSYGYFRFKTKVNN